MLQSILSMKNKTLIFDLDATLYYVGDKIEKLCDAKVVSYLVENMNVSESNAHHLSNNSEKNIATIPKLLKRSFLSVKVSL